MEEIIYSNRNITLYKITSGSDTRFNIDTKEEGRSFVFIGGETQIEDLSYFDLEDPLSLKAALILNTQLKNFMEDKPLSFFLEAVELGAKVECIPEKYVNRVEFSKVGLNIYDYENLINYFDCLNPQEEITLAEASENIIRYDSLRNLFDFEYEDILRYVLDNHPEVKDLKLQIFRDVKCDVEYSKLFLNKHPELFYFFDLDKVQYSVFEKALDIDPNLINYIPEKYRKNLPKKYINNVKNKGNSSILKMDENLITQEIVLSEVKKQPYLLKNPKIKNLLKKFKIEFSKEFYIESLNKYPSLLCCIPQEFATKNLVLFLCFKGNYSILNFGGLEFLNPDDITSLILRDLTVCKYLQNYSELTEKHLTLIAEKIGLQKGSFVFNRSTIENNNIYYSLLRKLKENYYGNDALYDTEVFYNTLYETNMHYLDLDMSEGSRELLLRAL